MLSGVIRCGVCVVRLSGLCHQLQVSGGMMGQVIHNRENQIGRCVVLSVMCVCVCACVCA